MYVMFVYNHYFFFFKQKTAYEMRISDWSSDVCSSDLDLRRRLQRPLLMTMPAQQSGLQDVEAAKAQLRQRLLHLALYREVEVAARPLCTDRRHHDHVFDTGGKGRFGAKPHEIVIDGAERLLAAGRPDRKSTRLNSSH